MLNIDNANDIVKEPQDLVQTQKNIGKLDPLSYKEVEKLVEGMSGEKLLSGVWKELP